MEYTPEQKAFSVVCFAKSSSPRFMRIEYQKKFGRHASVPCNRVVKRWIFWNFWKFVFGNVLFWRLVFNTVCFEKLFLCKLWFTSPQPRCFYWWGGESGYLLLRNFWRWLFWESLLLKMFFLLRTFFKFFFFWKFSLRMFFFENLCAYLSCSYAVCRWYDQFLESGSVNKRPKMQPKLVTTDWKVEEVLFRTTGPNSPL